MLGQAGPHHWMRGTTGLRISDSMMIVAGGTRRLALQQQQQLVPKQQKAQWLAAAKHGCLRPQCTTPAPRVMRHHQDMLICHSTIRSENQEPGDCPQSGQLQQMPDAADEPGVQCSSGIIRATTDSSANNTSETWQISQLELLAHKKLDPVTTASSGGLLPAGTSVKNTPHSSVTSISWPRFVVSMVAPLHDYEQPGDGNDTCSSSSSSDTSKSSHNPNLISSSSHSNTSPLQRRKNKLNGSFLSVTDRLSSLFNLPRPAAAELARRLLLPRPKGSVWKQQIMQLITAAEQGAHLVQLLKDVNPHELLEAAHKAGLELPPEHVPEHLPIGSSMDEGMLKCNCKLPISYRQATVAGPNQGRGYYRCRTYKFRRCFFVWRNHMDILCRKLPNGHKIRTGAQAAAEMWDNKEHQEHIRLLRKRWWDEFWDTKGTTAREVGYKALRQVLDDKDIIEDAAISEAGACGEAYLFLWLKRVLPGFDGTCWVSSNRRYLYPDPDGRSWSDVDSLEPPYDFVYTDQQGVLGVANVTYYIEAKCTGGVAMMQYETLRPIPISSNEWKKARDLHMKPLEGSYVIIYLDRIQRFFRPRLVTVLVDPYGLNKELDMVPQSVLVVDVEEHAQSGGRAGKAIVTYPVQRDVLHTAQSEIL